MISNICILDARHSKDTPSVQRCKLRMQRWPAQITSSVQAKPDLLERKFSPSTPMPTAL